MRTDVERDQAERIANLRREVGHLQAQLDRKERPEHEVREENQRLKKAVASMKFLLLRMPGLRDAEIEAVLEDLNRPGSLNPDRLAARDKLRRALEFRGSDSDVLTLEHLRSVLEGES